MNDLLGCTNKTRNNELCFDKINKKWPVDSMSLIKTFNDNLGNTFVDKFTNVNV